MMLHRFLLVEYLKTSLQSRINEAGLLRHIHRLILSLFLPSATVCPHNFSILDSFNSSTKTKATTTAKASANATAGEISTSQQQHHLCQNMSKLLRAYRFFEEEIPVVVLKEFNPEEAELFAKAMKFCISTLPNCPLRSLFPILINVLT